MIGAMMERCKAIDEYTWGLYALRRDLMYKKMPGDKSSYIHQAIACGKEQAEKILKEFQGLQPLQIAKELKLTIIEEDPFAMKGYYLFAEFREPETIVLYRSVIAAAQELAKKKGISFLHLPLEDHLVMHELFHYLEMKNPALYTRTETIPLKTIGPWKRQSGIKSLGEIAGMSFVKTFLALDYSPFLLDILLLYEKECQVANEIYHEIIALDDSQ